MQIPRTLDPTSRGGRAARLLVLALTVISLTVASGCSFSFSAGGKTAASAGGKSKKSGSGKASAKSDGQASAKSQGKKSASARVGGSTSGSAKGKSSSKTSVKVSGKKKFKGSSGFAFSSKGRVKGVSKTHKKSDDFRATFLVGGSAGKSYKFGTKASGKASERASGSVSLVGGAKGKGSIKGSGSAKGQTPSKKDPPKTTPKKDPPKKDPPKKDPPKKDPPKDTADKLPPPAPAPPPEEQEEVEVIEPPEEPPENVFGYDKPVRGCFEGIVYPLEPNTKKLPTDWEAMGAVSVVYACEWDIPTRDWETGFPGVDDLFEWFAIQYSGSFWVDAPGTWRFRVSSDDGMKMYIDGELVLDNDGVHPPRVKEVTVDLSKGEHEMVLEYFQGPRYHINLQLYATPPGGEEGIFSVR